MNHLLHSTDVFECNCWQKYTSVSSTDLYLSYFDLSYVFPGHNDRLQWGLTVFQVGILLQTYKPKICCELWKEVIFNETLGRNFVLLPLQRKLYRNIFHILQPQALIFGYLLLLNLKVWNVLVPKYFLAFEEADINQLLFSDDWWVSSTFWKKIFLKSNIRP